MAPVVIDLQNRQDLRDVVRQAAQAMQEGQLVLFPTETVYGLAAAAEHAEAVERLIASKGRATGHPLPVAIKDPLEAMEFSPDLSIVASRLARRCWPGPLTLVLRADHPSSQLHQLPTNVQEAVAPHKTIGLRVPSHPIILATLQEADSPFVLTSANLTGEPSATTAEEAIEALGDHLGLVLDGGPSQLGQASSVVEVQANQIKILRQGFLDAQTLKRLSSLVVLIVCTGNTCRSPMAELLMQERICKQQQWPVGELEDHGVLVVSAGIAAGAGFPASPEAVATLANQGMDLSGHESQPITDRLVKVADLILTMTRAHRQAIVARWPEAADRTHLLDRNNSDISDPIGGSAEVYDACAQQLAGQLEQWIPDLDFSGNPEVS